MLKSIIEFHHCSPKNQFSLPSTSILSTIRSTITSSIGQLASVYIYFTLICLLAVVQCQLDLTNGSITTQANSLTLIDDDLTTTNYYPIVNPSTDNVNTSSTNKELTSTNSSNVKIHYPDDHDYLNTQTNGTSLTGSTIKSTSDNHVTTFLDFSNEVITLPTLIPTNTTTTTLTSSEIDFTSNQTYLNDLSETTTSLVNQSLILTSPTLFVDDDNQQTTAKTVTINSNKSTTEVTIELITVYDNSTIDLLDNVIDANSSSILTTTDHLIDTNETTICDSNGNYSGNQVNRSRLTVDHYQAKKFFLLTIILLGLCCALILIVLILVAYVYRKLSKEKVVKIPRSNNNNTGSIEFDTIKDGRFNQWQSNVNSAFDSSDLAETAPTGYRFLDGSVVPYSERYHTDVKASSTETFGHHTSNNQPSMNNLSTVTVDTRL